MDPNLVPREYLLIDTAALRKVCVKLPRDRSRFRVCASFRKTAWPSGSEEKAALLDEKKCGRKRFGVAPLGSRT